MQVGALRVAVLGGGLQGSCIALELASRGAKVDIYERHDRCLAEASSHNTGKIHIGFVYARDTTLATARLLAEGSSCFEGLLKRWLGEASIATLPTSVPDHYVVHRQGLVTPSEFEHYGEQVLGLISTAFKKRNGTYFGRDVQRPLRRLTVDELAALYRPETAAAAYQTEEVSIDTELLAELVRSRIAAEPTINCLTQRTVVAVKEQGQSLIVTSTAKGVFDSEGYDFVANALWSGRLSIDVQLDLLPKTAWCHRFRYFVRARASSFQEVPSTTVLLGRFGEFINFDSGLLILSWYPAGLMEWSTAREPAQRPLILTGAPAEEIKNSTIDGLASVVRGVDLIKFSGFEVRGAWIFALGNTDIDNPTSVLHQRSAAGVTRRGRYLTIDTGKLTLAPLFAEQAVDLMMH